MTSKVSKPLVFKMSFFNITVNIGSVDLLPGYQSNFTFGCYCLPIVFFNFTFPLRPAPLPAAAAAASDVVSVIRSIKKRSPVANVGKGRISSARFELLSGLSGTLSPAFLLFACRPLVFSSTCGLALLSISRPRAFILSYYLPLHPPPPPCHYLFRPRKGDRAGVGGEELPAAALRAKIFVTRPPVALPSSVRPSLFVFPLALSHDLLFGCRPKRDEKGGASTVPRFARLAAFLSFTLKKRLKVQCVKFG